MTKIYCDKCKKQLEDWIELGERYTINLQGGYGSVFGDGGRVYIELCQHCLYDILEREGLLNEQTATPPVW